MPVYDPLESIDPSELGARLRDARKVRGWTQQQAAGALGVAQTTLAAIERGKRHIHATELVRLSRLYERRLWTLLAPPALAQGLEGLVHSSQSGMDEELLSAWYRYLAVRAWQRGGLSEGQLASFLGISRLTARKMAWEIGLDADEDDDIEKVTWEALLEGRAEEPEPGVAEGVAWGELRDRLRRQLHGTR